MADDEQEEQGFGWKIAVGITISVLASTASNLGVNVQKFSFNLEAKKPIKLRTPYLRQWRWWLGLSLVIFGAIGDFTAFAFAPASIVTPVGSFTLVTNIFFAHCWLGEAVGPKDFAGTALIVTGATVAVAFGDHSSPEYTLEELEDLWTRVPMYIYLGVVGGMLLFMWSTIRSAESVLTEAAGVGPDGKKNKTRFSFRDLVPPEAYRKYERLHPLCYAGMAGTLGAQTVLFAKSTAEILRTTFAGDNQMVHGVTYVILGCMFATIFAQQHWLASGLNLFDALYIVPVFQAFFIGVSVAAGGIYFKEFSHFSKLQWVLFPTGVVLALIGVLLLADRNMTDSEESELEKPLTASPIKSPISPPKPPRRRGSNGSLQGNIGSPDTIRIQHISTPRRRSVFHLILPTRSDTGAVDSTIAISPRPTNDLSPMSRRTSFLRPEWLDVIRDNPTPGFLPTLRLGRRRAQTTGSAEPEGLSSLRAGRRPSNASDAGPDAASPVSAGSAATGASQGSSVMPAAISASAPHDQQPFSLPRGADGPGRRHHPHHPHHRRVSSVASRSPPRELSRPSKPAAVRIGETSEGDLATRPRTLSPGQTGRRKLSRALANNPRARDRRSTLRILTSGIVDMLGAGLARHEFAEHMRRVEAADSLVEEEMDLPDIDEDGHPAHDDLEAGIDSMPMLSESAVEEKGVDAGALSTSSREEKGSPTAPRATGTLSDESGPTAAGVGLFQGLSPSGIGLEGLDSGVESHESTHSNLPSGAAPSADGRGDDRGDGGSDGGGMMEDGAGEGWIKVESPKPNSEDGRNGNGTGDDAFLSPRSDDPFIDPGSRQEEGAGSDHTRGSTSDSKPTAV